MDDYNFILSIWILLYILGIFSASWFYSLVYGSELIYAITAISTILMLITILSIAIIFFMAYLYNYDKERNNFENTKFYSKSIFINILSILILIAINNLHINTAR